MNQGLRRYRRELDEISKLKEYNGLSTMDKINTLNRTNRNAHWRNRLAQFKNMVKLDCQGEWQDISKCDTECNIKYEVKVQARNNGIFCPNNDGDKKKCQPGEGECPLNINCEGTWSPCTEKCETMEQRIWNETQAKSGQGTECPLTTDCQPGEGGCPLNIDCEGTWSPCTEKCETSDQRIWNETQAKEGNGNDCPVATDCISGEGECPSLSWTDNGGNIREVRGCPPTLPPKFPKRPKRPKIRTKDREKIQVIFNNFRKEMNKYQTEVREFRTKIRGWSEGVRECGGTAEEICNPFIDSEENQWLKNRDNKFKNNWKRCCVCQATTPRNRWLSTCGSQKFGDCLNLNPLPISKEIVDAYNIEMGLSVEGKKKLNSLSNANQEAVSR